MNDTNFCEECGIDIDEEDTRSCRGCGQDLCRNCDCTRCNLDD